MSNRDTVLLETVKTHRSRLQGAFLYGPLTERRVVNDNVKRLIGGVVLAAVLCAGCVGFSFVSSLRAGQAAAQREQAGLGPATGPVFAADTFDRSLDRGWGASERGGRWALGDQAADFWVEPGAGLIYLPEDRTRTARLPATLQDRSDLTVTLQRRAGVQAGTVAVSALARRVSGSQDYRAVVLLGDDGSVALTLIRRSEPRQPDDPEATALSNTVTLLGPQPPQPGVDPPPVSLRVQALGTNPTTLRAKVWVGNAAEPAGWTVQASDTEAGLQRPGQIGVSARRDGEASREVTLAVLDIVGRVAP